MVAVRAETKARFRAAFRKDRQPLRLFETTARFPARLSLIFTGRLRGNDLSAPRSAEVDETFRARLGSRKRLRRRKCTRSCCEERAVG